VTISKIMMCVVLAFVCTLSFSCATTTYREVFPILSDGKYDSEFPYRGCSEQLEKVSESVKMVSCIAYYRSLIFSQESKIRLHDISSIFLREKANKEIFLNRTASGSATVIYCQNQQIALLTCSHVVDFPDTIVTYYRKDEKRLSEFIQSVAIKDRQSNYVAAIQGANNLQIIIQDKENDLVVIGQRFENQVNPLTATVFDYPIGKAKELEWGAFVYLFGYPAGYRVVTKGIVSNPNRDKYGAFLTDAVFNRGFSGGVILAVRDGVPNFELVGMVKLVPGHQQFYMSPVKDGEMIEYDPETPYAGDIYVDSRIDIIYGVAPAIPSEMIIEFLSSNQEKLSEKGYHLSSFLERQPSVKK
jgi:hypothetical protein